MNKIWIVCQESEGRKPVHVAAFAQKDAAAEDCYRRIMAAPDEVWFWLQSVEMPEANKHHSGYDNLKVVS